QRGVERGRGHPRVSLRRGMMGLPNPGAAWIRAEKPGPLLRQLLWTCATANRVAPALHDHFLSTCARAEHNTFQWIDSIRYLVYPPHSSVKACCQGVACWAVWSRMLSHVSPSDRNGSDVDSTPRRWR